MNMKVEKQITLPVLLGDWIKHDEILQKHFGVQELAVQDYIGAIFYDCRWPKSPMRAGTTAYNMGLEVVKIHEDRVTFVFARQALYKFQAVHPMFFQKLRGWLYDMHNRYDGRCKEYLR